MRITPLPLFSLALLASIPCAQWVSGPSFPAEREFSAGVFTNGRVWALGGSPFDGNEDGAVHSIAPTESAWTVEIGVEGPKVRNAAGVDSLGRIILFGGVDGLDPDGDEGKAYWYDLVEGPKGSVAQRSAAAPFDGLAFATDDSARLYSIGGGTGAPGNASAQVERYTASTDTWQVLAPLPAARAHAAATADGRGGIVVVGGYDAAGALSASVARYDVALGAWTASAFPDLPVATAGARAVLGANEHLYVVGGRTASGVTTATWILDQDAGVWSNGPALGVARERFGATFGPNDEIWVLGGTNASGGVSGVERLYTPTCPTFSAPTAYSAPWSGSSIVLAATVDGGTPLALRWRKDGVELFDGPAAGGGWITGADTATLVVAPCAPADEGAYDLVAGNPCGQTISDATVVEVKLPPDVSGSAGDWVTWTKLGPGALDTTLYAVDGDALGGSGKVTDPTYGSLDHPFLWTLGPAGPGSATDLTPPGSVGGGIYTIKNGVQAGWYWWPYTTPLGTGYDKHACTWAGTAASFFNKQPSGWEYGSISQTDGTRFVGTLTFSDSSTTSDGHFFPGASAFATKLTPAIAWGSGTAALDGDFQYGNVNLGFGVVHAARWSGTSGTFVDINPAGSSWSYVLGAGDGQAVGRATLGGANHAGLWDSTGAYFQDLNPAGAASSEAYACNGGLQVGVAQVGTTRAWLWSGAGGAEVDLHALLSGSYQWSYARDILVDDDGTITVVGVGYNSVAGRSEGLIWRLAGAPLLAGPDAISAAAGGAQQLGIYAGPANAGALYIVAGSLSGTSPGTPWSSVVIPLNVDAYTLFSINHANQLPFVSTFGVLDDQGRGSASFTLPPGWTVPGLPLTAHHAAVVIDPVTAAVTLATNAVALELEP